LDVFEPLEVTVAALIAARLAPRSPASRKTGRLYVTALAASNGRRAST
jgi:hypothetical protein